MSDGGVRFKVVIPARYASSRLPAKPLLDLGGKPMVARVAERAVYWPIAQVIGCVGTAGTHEQVLIGQERCGAVGLVYFKFRQVELSPRNFHIFVIPDRKNGLVELQRGIANGMVERDNNIVRLGDHPGINGA